MLIGELGAQLYWSLYREKFPQVVQWCSEREAPPIIRLSAWFQEGQSPFRILDGA